MKKRLLCLILCLSITFFSIGYKAPKAEAFVGTGTAIAITLASMCALGWSFLVTYGQQTDLYEILETKIQEFMDDNQDNPVVSAVGTTISDFYDAVTGPAGFSGGAVVVAKSSVDLLSAFKDWLSSDVGTVEEGSPVLVVDRHAIPLSNGNYFGLSGVGSRLNNNAGVSNGHFTPLSYGQSFTVSSAVQSSGVDWSVTGASVDLLTFSNGVTLLGKRVSPINYNIDYYYSVDGTETKFLSGASTWTGGKSIYLGFAEGSLSMLISDSYNGSDSFWIHKLPTEVVEGLDISNVVISAQESTSVVTVPENDDDSVAISVAGIEAPDLATWSTEFIADYVSDTVTPTAEVVPGADVLPDTITGWLELIWNTIRSIPDAIAEAIQGVLSSVFALDPALATEITTYFQTKFNWLTPLHTWASNVFSLTPVPPVIYINLQNAGSHYGYNYGGREVALDLSWYSQYKSDVDALISGFLWLGFLWLLFKRAADIIQGAGMAQNEANEIFVAHDLDDRDHLFRRRKYR